MKPYLRSAGCRTAIASSRSAIDGKTVDGSKSSKPVGKLRESLLNVRYDSVGISIVLKNMDGGAIFADVVLRERSRLLLGRGNERRDEGFVLSRVRNENIGQNAPQSPGKYLSTPTNRP